MSTLIFLIVVGAFGALVLRKIPGCVELIQVAYDLPLRWAMALAHFLRVTFERQGSEPRTHLISRIEFEGAVERGSLAGIRRMRNANLSEAYGWLIFSSVPWLICLRWPGLQRLDVLQGLPVFGLLAGFSVLACLCCVANAWSIHRLGRPAPADLICQAREYSEADPDLEQRAALEWLQLTYGQRLTARQLQVWEGEYLRVSKSYPRQQPTFCGSCAA